MSASDTDVATEAAAPTGSSPPTKVERADVILGASFIVFGIYTVVLLPFARRSAAPNMMVRGMMWTRACT